MKVRPLTPRSLFPAILLVVMGYGAPLRAQAELETYVRSLSSPDENQRIEAVLGLGELGQPAAIQPLSETVRSDPLPEVRQWALHSLAQIGTAEAIEVIRTAIEQDADPRVRAFAAHRLTELAVAVHNASSTPLEPPEVDDEPRAEATATIVVNSPIVQQQNVNAPVVQQNIATAMPDVSLGVVQERSRAGRGLIASGWSIFGVSYAASFSALIEDDFGAVAVPIVGPMVAGAILLADSWCDEDIIFGVTSIVTSLIQTAGLTMAIVGHVRRRRAQQQSRGFAVTPTGLGVAGIF